MRRKQAKPAWWLLFATVPVMIGLLLLIGRMGLPQWLEFPSAIVVIVGSFGFMGLWVHLNAARLSEEEMSRDGGADSIRITVYEPAKSIGESRQGKVVYLDVSAADASQIDQDKRGVYPVTRAKSRPLRRTSGMPYNSEKNL